MNLEYILNSVNRHDWEPEALKRKLERRFPNLRPIGRSRFVMLAALAELVISNRKHTTIRYTPRAVEFPCQAILPLFIVEEGEPHDKARPHGKLRIGRVQYKKVRNLNDRTIRAGVLFIPCSATRNEILPQASFCKSDLGN